jgi:hypothetical protein
MVRLIYPTRCELEHNWQAQHPRRDRGAEFFPNPQDRKAACGLFLTSPKLDAGCGQHRCSIMRHLCLPHVRSRWMADR